MSKRPIIAVDFDGTCVEHEYPDVGADVVGAVSTLKRMAKTANLILWTMRSGKELDDAVEWFKFHGIPLWGVNSNPEQHTWTQSPKAYAMHYIDDAAIGCPLMLTNGGRTPARPVVRWTTIMLWFKQAYPE